MTMQQQLNSWVAKYPLLENIVSLKPVVWLNPKLQKKNDMSGLPVSFADMKEAELLWQRFAPYLAAEFPETAAAKGIVESPLREISGMKQQLNDHYDAKIEGKLFLKCDNELPIAGSIKARGGVYEVLHHAEKLAIDAGMLTTEQSYEQFSSDGFKHFFSRYSIGVGSTGNLGLSIGIISAKLGFQVSVYMSSDAKQWKKDLLREKGATVVEFEGDFSEAIWAGRETTLAKSDAYFVDDEKSKHLFLGYSVAAFRLKQQLDDADIPVDANHPLFVYLPCGVGGAPGGIAFGLKQVLGDAVHCFFVEPTHSPAVLIGLMTGEKEKLSVQDFGIDNVTEGDGLAVGRPSSFASGISEKTVSGIYTIEDQELFKLLTLLADSEAIFVEPSATAGLLGPLRIKASSYAETNQIPMATATHIGWSTGGALVPEEEMDGFYHRGKTYLGG
ncbi:D-serine dehydratase [Planococcus antarcticus DSM 14505]|uniref:Probable D-serine dehydratase n=1 Tax=Planococcus antarcticus DSM 14505 TaxID=1185653 RepID=A0A1C7DG69_9BACL|nr:D-serine ammonia-lyase [Planococcus antarcticus]ANU10496.1 D-serine ammonia-lyase [Planococcus antarcticus DSM 14505]EIM07764.1 D-serine dehydratase [Planococcus antarcticus DSM 14505]